MYIDLYFQEMKKVLEKIEETQKDTIVKCSRIIAESITHGGAWHIQDSGHMLMFECINRAGGMAAIKPIKINVDIQDNVRKREGDKEDDFNVFKIPETANVVLKMSKLREGDVLMIGSVSGYSVFPIELALQAKKLGVTTIALTGKAFSERITPQHPSGLRLYEACDYVLDNCTNYGDAIVHLGEIDKDLCPASGIGAAYIMWALQTGVCEELIKTGKNPSIFKSIHAPDGQKVFSRALEQYQKEGY